MKLTKTIFTVTLFLLFATNVSYAESPTQNEQLALQHQLNVANAPKHLPAKVRLLAQIVDAESGGEDYVGKVAVAEVVLNRVDSDEFPDNVYDVIFQENQFEPVRNGSLQNEPSEESYKAVYEALDGSNYAMGSLYFYNAKTAKSRWLDQFPTTTIIGSHTFK